MLKIVCKSSARYQQLRYATNTSHDPYFNKLELQMFVSEDKQERLYRPNLNVDQFWVMKKDFLPVVEDHDEIEQPYNLTIYFGKHRFMSLI